MASEERGIKFAVSFGCPPKDSTRFYKFLGLARTAEKLGFDGVFYIDHLFLRGDRVKSWAADPERPQQYECWTTLAALATATQTIRVGPIVTPISLRHPSFVAKMAGTVDIISNGRLVLPLGTGWQEREYTAFSFPFDKSFSVRYEKMVEGVEIIKKLWTEDNLVSYEGKHYKIDRAPFWPKPIQKPHPPIWFGGSGRKTRMAVAKYGDGWCPAAPHYLGVTPEVYHEGFQEICALAEAEGRDPKKITPGFLASTAIAETTEKALEKASVVRRRVDWADMSIEEFQQKGIIIAGSPDDCIKRYQQYVDAGVRYFILSFIPIDVEEVEVALQLYAEHVLPHFGAR